MGTNSQQQFSHYMQKFEKQNRAIKEIVDQQRVRKTLLAEITQWEKESITKIQATAKKITVDAEQLSKKLNNLLTGLSQKLLVELNMKSSSNVCLESDIQRWNELLEICDNELKKLNAVKVVSDESSSLNLIKIENILSPKKETPTISAQKSDRFGNRSTEDIGSDIPPPNSEFVIRRFERPSHMVAGSSPQMHSYPVITFGINASINKKVQELFEHLTLLRPMDKYGSMSGDCDFETTQMEKFLSKAFGFKNVPGKNIVQGVQSFKLDKPLHSMNLNTEIYFPTKTASKSFAMTVQEIRQWQSSYGVYADGNVPGMNRAFLQKALQGLSNSGEEAFRMKFIVRISKCPILMEFDAQIIHRELSERWPHNIKLVSVTGVDFAGRIHDVDDIRTYVLNWRNVYEIDRTKDTPRVYNGRDFNPVPGGPQGRLDEKRLLNDLIRMARLRLRACDIEGVQIVVETGVGLGVFAGKYIGIDERVRALSASAIRTVLEQDEALYENILGVVFALPVFDIDHRNGQRQDNYQAFASEFGQNTYKGRIPVLIADQDMHRLTVAIACKDFIVSELNPADSHGVFGEYWQNRGPAVEEKLALTTLGLLVQHHLINTYVLDSNRYHLI